MSDREQLRTTFNSAAASYHSARPSYPAQVLAAVETHSGIRPPADVLEIGCGPGTATIPLLERGFAVTGVELGSAMADEARLNTAGFANASIVCASFDSWEPPSWGAFDLVVAATSWHWLDPATRYERARRHLRPGGALAVWAAGHVVPDDGDPIFAELQSVYDEIGESQPSDAIFPRPGELPDMSAEIVDSGCFSRVVVEHIDWEMSYDADGYIALLDTFSGHIAMGPTKRDHLYGEIRRHLANRPDGLLRRHWGVALHVAMAV